MPQKPSVRMLIRPSTVVLPSSLPRVGEPVTPAHLGQQDIRGEYDSKILFYDVFQSGERIVLSGPPLLHSQAKIGGADYYDQNQRALSAYVRDIDGTQRSFIESPEGSTFVTISMEETTVSVPVGPDLNRVFEGLNVLFAKSMDNLLVWIRDWAEFHVKQHGVDGVLIYDDGSTLYAPEEILAAVGSIDGLKSLVVVDWTFKSDPPSGRWHGLKDSPEDSEIGEHGIMEHARWRFLISAKSVVNAAIDELVLTSDHQTALDVLASSPAPVLRHRGRWIEKTVQAPGQLPRFSDFSSYDASRSHSTSRWLARPADIPEASQWKPHEVKDAETAESSTVMHRRFMAIDSGWTPARTTVRSIAASDERTDDVLADALRRVFAPNTAGIDGSPAASPRKVIPNRALVALGRILEQSQALRLHPTKLWFYSSDCLVLDMKWNGERVAVDVVLTDDDLMVKLHARTARGQEVVDRVVAQTGCPLRSGKYLITRLPLSVDLDVTGRALLGVLKNLWARSQEPAEAP